VAHHGVNDYMAHGFCLLWEPALVWLHVISDIAIGLAYYSIPIAIFYFLYKRRDLPFPGLFVLFGIIFFSCGTTHLFSAYIIYKPEYWTEGIVKAFTAFISVGSAILFIPYMPKAIALPRLPRALEEIKALNAILEKQVEELRIKDSAIASTTNAIAFADLEGRLTYVNNAFLKLWGYESKEEVLGNPVLVFLESDEHSADLIETMRKSGNWTGELAAKRSDGKLFPVELTWSFVLSESGKPIRLMGLFSDITERKNADKAQQASLHFLETVHKHTEIKPLLDALASEIKDYTGCDSVAIRVLDDVGNIPYQAHEGFSTKFVEMESPLSIKSDQCMCINIITGTTNPRLPFYTKGGSFYMNGTTRFLARVSEEEKEKTRNVCNSEGYESVALVPFRSGGRILGLIHVADHRENMVPLKMVEQLESAAMQLGTAFQRANAEDALRKSEKKYKELVESTLDGVYQMDADDKFVLMNPAGARMFGYESPDEIIGRKGLDYWRDPGDRDVFRAELKIKKSVSAYHMRLKKKNGEPIDVETSSTIKEDGNGVFLGMEGILRNVTERKHLEAQLRHAQKMEAVGTLAGGIAHDFNNILNVIMGYGSMILDKLEADSPTKGHMNEVMAAAEKAAVLTKRLLAFSRKQLTEVKPININEIITGIQKMLIRIMGEDIDFHLDLSDRCLTVMADTGQIEQVLMNLAANARDAMPDGGQLTIGTGRQEIDDEYIALNGYGIPGKYAIITVSDTGRGMDAETQKKIFEPFFTTKGVGEGTGLGLAISYGIIKQNNGYIKVYSEPGQGTVFKIYLPLLEESALPDKKTEAPDAVKGGNETVLVAEDDASLRDLTRIVLESFGYSIIEAVDGDDAIIKFMENRDRIHLVMLDMIMPRKNGKEVSEVLRKANPRTKILFVSGYTMDIIKYDDLTESGFDFIHKPMRPQDLLIKVREVLDK